MANYTKEFLEKTIQVWQPYSSTPLSLEDGREICGNLCGFFSVLKEWDEKERRRVENEGSCDLRDSDNPNQT